MGLFGFFASMIGLGAMANDAFNNSLEYYNKGRAASKSSVPTFISGGHLYSSKTGKRCYSRYDYNGDRIIYDYKTDMPSGVLKSEDDVLNYIKTMDYQEEINKTKKMIKEKLIHLGGNATEMCLEKLFER